MAKVLQDFIPTISDIIDADKPTQDLTDKVNGMIHRLNEVLRTLSTAVNTIEFGDGSTAENVLGNWIGVEFSTAGVELTGTHTLNKAPQAIIGTRLDRPGSIYFSKAPSTTEIYLKSDTDSLSGRIMIV